MNDDPRLAAILDALNDEMVELCSAWGSVGDDYPDVWKRVAAAILVAADDVDRRSAEVEMLAAERDRARDTAARYAAEIAEMRSVIRAIQMNGSPGEIVVPDISGDTRSDTKAAQ